MPTTQGRPFLSNFLAAFRAHSALQQQTKATSTTVAATSSTQAHPSTQAAQPRTITTSTKQGATTAALTSLHSPRATHSTSPLSASPGSSPADHHPTSQEPTASTNRRYTPPRNRRGSDSSSEGFRDVLGAEKWYIGGRTAAGEEKYFKLGVVRRQRSGDRLSLDRLSL